LKSSLGDRTDVVSIQLSERRKVMLRRFLFHGLWAAVLVWQIVHPGPVHAQRVRGSFRPASRPMVTPGFRGGFRFDSRFRGGRFDRGFDRFGDRFRDRRFDRGFDRFEDRFEFRFRDRMFDPFFDRRFR
jgi:hypothetical protein